MYCAKTKCSLNHWGGHMTTLEATIHERGNGFPDVGDFVAGDDGEVYTVVELVGPIHTAAAGCSNYVHATVELAAWSDVTDDTEPVCSCVLQTD